MNLIDAVKGERPFRRKGWERWARMQDDDFRWIDGVGYQGIYINKQDILADDWEIQEPEVSITRTQFWEALRSAHRDAGTLYGKREAEIFVEAARRLGLEAE